MAKKYKRISPKLKGNRRSRIDRAVDRAQTGKKKPKKKK